MDAAKPRDQPSPIACNVRPFSAEQRQRWDDLGRRLRSGVREIRDLPNGFALRIPTDAETLTAAAEWMTLDRLCCPFLTFTLEIECEDGPAWVVLTGRPEAKQFLADLLR